MTDQPFTVAVCQADPCRPHDPGFALLPQLAAIVRQRPQSVLVRTGCLLRAPRCQPGAAHDRGCYLVVQPCDARRRPSGAAIPIGPVLTRADAEAVAAWLADADLDADRLNPRLRLGRQAA
ncbi:hypothetical protein [Nonomuraea turcica]|uniref:hypothetical protein n=1 Tax=Nonomuraea sp. G32 TaxID=3067274 RepID=UPI00273C8488|nr:hypothetical protein [Nonomuraea sp. G32]MDP4509322.1 hypothetical protein [Nonomuraea sp. G32]